MCVYRQVWLGAELVQILHTHIDWTLSHELLLSTALVTFTRTAPQHTAAKLQVRLTNQRDYQ